LPEPSVAALDLMTQILVEKERRLCSMQYQANDYGRRLQGAQIVRCRMDKTHPDYPGYFVFPNDAEDIKRHPFFRGVDWERLHNCRPPYIPIVRNCLDTKYFDDEGPVSDIDSTSSIEEDDTHHIKKADVSEPRYPFPKPSTTKKQHSQHRPEAQNIVPSFAMKAVCPRDEGTLGQAPDRTDRNGWPNHLLAPRHSIMAAANNCDSHAPTLVDFANQVDGPVEKIVSPAIKTKKKEKKRARDIILRDPVTTTQAMKIRKATAFLGYDYKKPSMIAEVLERAIIGDHLARTVKGHGEQAHNEYYDQVVKSSTYHEPGGHVHPNMKRARL
jgi:hypothetical protein